MEALTNMMSIIDHNSKSISEGDYLKLCNLMRDLHKTIPQKVVPTREDLIARCQNIYTDIARVVGEIKEIKRILAASRIRQRVTEGVRREAILFKAGETGVFLESYTIDCLRTAGVVIDDTRVFYKEYLNRTNEKNIRRSVEGRVMLDLALRDHERLLSNLREVGDQMDDPYDLISY
jgi:hypothetical protein